MTAPNGAASDASPDGDRCVNDASPNGDRCVNDASPDGDRIELRDLRVMCVVGALAHERTAPQPLSIDVDLYADLSRAGATDNLADTIDYGGACDRIVALCATEAPQLLERLAELIAADLCSLDAVTAATVTVTKLRPPVAADLATSAVRIIRRRPA